MLSLPSLVRIYLHVEPVNLHFGFDRLANLVREEMSCDPLSGHLFVFRNRRGDRMKLLFWDEDGSASRAPPTASPPCASRPVSCPCCSGASMRRRYVVRSGFHQPRRARLEPALHADGNSRDGPAVAGAQFQVDIG
jgi:hypothetical protein